MSQTHFEITAVSEVTKYRVTHHFNVAAGFSIFTLASLETPLLQSGQTRSWKTVLQSYNPTCLNTPAYKFLVCLVRPLLASSGV